MSLTEAIRKELENARAEAEALKKRVAVLKNTATQSKRLADFDDFTVEVEQTIARAEEIKAVAQMHQEVLAQALKSAERKHRKALDLEQQLTQAQEAQDIAQRRLREFGDDGELSKQLKSVKAGVTALERQKEDRAAAKVKAMAEFEAAKKAFSEAKASNATEECRWFNWSNRAASAQLVAVAAQVSEQAESKVQQANEELSGIDQELAENRLNLKQLKQRATERAKAIEELEFAKEQIRKLIKGKGNDSDDAHADLLELKRLAETAAVVEAALKTVNQAGDAAFNYFKKNASKVEWEMYRAVTDGTIFNAPPGSDRANAIADFRNGGRGGVARRLAATLGSAPTSAAFLAVMGAEAIVPVNSQIDAPPKSKVAAQTQSKWQYPDGTLVRYKPLGDLYSSGKPTYSIEIKININANDFGPAGIACKVDPRGRAVPKDEVDLSNPFQDAEEKEFRKGVMRLGHRRLGP